MARETSKVIVGVEVRTAFRTWSPRCRFGSLADLHSFLVVTGEWDATIRVRPHGRHVAARN
jgi:hypothetical protein